MTSIWDVKSLIHSNDGVQCNDNNLDGEVENVEACLGSVPSWVRIWSRDIIDARSKCGAKGEQHGREKENEDLASKPSVSELLNRRSIGDDDPEGQQGNWKKSCYCKISSSNQLNVVIDPPGIWVERIEALDRAGNQCYQHENDGDVVELECKGEPLRPSPMGMRCSDNSLSKDEIDDEENEYSSRYKDLGSYRDRDIVGVGRPDKAHGHGRNSGHTEAENQTTHDKLLLPSEVDLENSHVSCSSNDEQSKKHRTDGVIERLRRQAS